MNLLKSILNKIADLLVLLVLVISVTITVLAVSSRASGVPNLMGYTLLSVQTDSMEPTLAPGDLIAGKLNQDAAEEYEVGDIVTFRMVVDRSLILNTHRIIKKELIGETIYYTTQGDNAAGADTRQIVSGDIVSSYRGFRLPHLGTLMDYLRTQKGFFLCVLLPMIVLFGIQLYNFVRNLIEYNKEKAVDAAKAAAEAAQKASAEAAAKVTAELTEEQKQQAIREYLEKQAKQQAADAKEASAKVAEETAAGQNSEEKTV